MLSGNTSHAGEARQMNETIKLPGYAYRNDYIGQRNWLQAS